MAKIATAEEYISWIDSPEFFSALLSEGWENLTDNMVHDCNAPEDFEDLETERGMAMYDAARGLAKKTLIDWMEANL